MNTVKYINVDGTTYKLGGEGEGGSASLNYANGQVMIQADQDQGRAPETDADSSYGHIYSPDGCEVATTANGRLFIKKIYSQEGGEEPMISGESEAINFYAPDGHRGLSVGNDVTFLSQGGTNQNIRISKSNQITLSGESISEQATNITLHSDDNILIKSDDGQIDLRGNKLFFEIKDPDTGIGIPALKSTMEESIDGISLALSYKNHGTRTDAIRCSGDHIKIAYPNTTNGQGAAISITDFTPKGDEDDTAKHLVLNSSEGEYQNDATECDSGMQLVIYNDRIVMQSPNGKAWFDYDGHFYVNDTRLA